jgi:hypothetical protein
MDAKAVELRGWLRQQFPEHPCEVTVRGRQLIVVALSPAWPTDPDPLVRLRCDAGGHWDISYWRHTGRWEVIPPLGGSWPAVRQALADDPMGLFWVGLD